MPSSRPELEALRLGGTAEPWERLGFATDQPVGGVRLVFEGGEPGLNGWVLGTPSAERPRHPNGITGIDHVVGITSDFDATVERLTADGFDHRRTRDAGDGRRQAFFVLGPCLLELAGPVEGAGELDLWGITFVGDDLERFGTPKDAVQPGRRIVTVKRDARLGFPVAVMNPR